MAILSEQDRQDMQALLARGFGHLPHSAFCLLTVNTAEPARRWLMEIIDALTPASQKPQHTALQLAVTYKGLDALGLPKKILAMFSDPFRSGMTTPHKRRILGDVDASAPEQWAWGGPDNDPVHIMLLCYADTADNLQTLVDAQTHAAKNAGMTLIQQLPGESLSDHREHFGFRDGLAQPYIAEFDRHHASNQAQAVPLGEFVLGYPNGYNRYTQRPLVSPESDTDHLLPEDLEGSGQRDLGRNGSYLVYRQLAQDVPKFWSYLLAQAAEHSQAASAAEDIEGVDAKTNAALYLAAKMVGRWPNGAALVKAPTLEASRALADASAQALDDFMYHREDELGHKCPLGAHIRRANPRDSLDPEPGTQKSIDFSNRHRLLRRGRPYGKPVCNPLEPAAILQKLLSAGTAGQASSESAEMASQRGLHFLCLGANIQRQFEFVQYTWCTNPNFNGLYNDPDPIMGDRAPQGKKQDNFTIQQPFLRRQLRSMPTFVETKGGAYFFLPSKRAMRYMLINCE